MGVEKPDRRPRCGEDGTCCGAVQGCGDMDPPRTSGWWLIVLAVIILVVVGIGHHHGI